MNKAKFKAYFFKHYRLILLLTILLIAILALLGVIYVAKKRAVAPEEEKKTETPVTPQAAPEEAKKEIVTKPPKRSTGGNITGSVRTNADGSQTVSISTGGSTGNDSEAAAAGPSGSIAGIDYIDETGQNPTLGDQLKAYMSSNLRVSGEVNSLYAIIVENAGDTGWAGLYSASYTQQPSGDITSAWGYITLNTYYYQSSPYFVDYMKLILSHEYGHHYTLYYKWLLWDLGAGVRFPDSYYTARSLSKATTAADYSKGWANCDAEIIAEDYSYLFSGYGYHAMAGTYGYPSGAVRTWIVNEPNGPAAAPAGDAAPTVAVTTPANGATLSGTVAFSANASDDVSVSSVGFYVDDVLVAEDSSAPYSINLNTASYSNAAHTLKARVADSSAQTAESSITVTISNASSDSTNPTVTIEAPAGNPYSWTSGDLYIRVTASDNVAIQKIDLYINDYAVATENDGLMERVWQWTNVGAGSYTLKARATDTSGNTAETSIVINKS